MSASNLRRGALLNRVYAPEANAALYQDALALIVQAEAHGLGSAWVAQHHFGGETGRLPSPLVLLAAASAETTRIRLGTAVIVLPTEGVLRLAEDAAVLDALSQRRLELGLGAGFDTASFAGFGAPFDTRGHVHAARIERLRALFAGETPDAALTEARLTPPAPSLAARLWEASGAIEDVARRGAGLITATQPADRPDASTLIARYRAAWPASGPAGAASPRVMLARAIFPGSDAASVEAEIGPDILRYLESRGAAVDSAELPVWLKRLGVLWGTPAQIVDAIGEARALAGVDILAAQIHTFSTTHAEAARRLEIFAERILPALDFDPAPVSATAA